MQTALLKFMRFWATAVPLPCPHSPARLVLGHSLLPPGQYIKSRRLWLHRNFAAQVAAKETEAGPDPQLDQSLTSNAAIAARIALSLQEASESIQAEEQEDLQHEAALHREESQPDESWQDVAARSQEEQEWGKADKRGIRSAARPAERARLYEDDEHGIRGVHIPRSAWTVLLKLRAAGHEGYIVGGAVRDMLLKGTPKDFDILTSATVQQVKKLLHRSRMVGKRFPIVQVMVDGSMLEVSSFATGVPLYDLPFDAAALLGSRNAKLGSLTSTQGQALLWKGARQQNAQARDFTVNALMYDPFSRIIFDYTGGMADCRRQLLRTIAAPEKSFQQDPARILRAVRLAARAGLKIEDGTAKAIEKSRHLILDLPSGRVSMEVQALLAYGSAAESVRLLWRLGVLDILFPVLADYLERKKYPRNPRKPRKEELFNFLERMDTKASPEQPLTNPVWATILMVPVIRHLASAEGGITGWEKSWSSRATSLASSSTPVADKDIPAASNRTRTSAERVGLNGESVAHGSGQQDLYGEREPHLEALLEADREGDLDLVNDSNAGASPYLQLAEHVLNAFIDSTGAVSVVPKVARMQVLWLLSHEEAHRKQINQMVQLKCGRCGNFDTMPLHVKVPKCSSCGGPLPTKPLRKRRTPDIRAVIDILSHNADAATKGLSQEH